MFGRTTEYKRRNVFTSGESYCKHTLFLVGDRERRRRTRGRRIIRINLICETVLHCLDCWCCVYRFSLPSIPKMTWNMCGNSILCKKRNSTLQALSLSRNRCPSKFIQFRDFSFSLSLSPSPLHALLPLIGLLTWQTNVEGWFAVLINDDSPDRVTMFVGRSYKPMDAFRFRFNPIWRTWHRNQNNARR